MLNKILRYVNSVISGNGIFPSEKDKYLARLEQAHGESVDDFMRLFSWIVYLENKYDTYHTDGPIKELFEQIWAGEDSPYDKMLN